MNIGKDAIKRTIKVTFSFVTLFVGGSIYVLYRSENLLMFSWFQDLGLLQFIQDIRSEFKSDNLYGWVKNSMPAGLWLFSYMLIIDSIWEKNQNYAYMLFLYALPVLAILSEVMQFLGILSGTFDFMDVICYTSAILFFILIKKKQL